MRVRTLRLDDLKLARTRCTVRAVWVPRSNVRFAARVHPQRSTDLTLIASAPHVPDLTVFESPLQAVLLHRALRAAEVASSITLTRGRCVERVNDRLVSCRGTCAELEPSLLDELWHVVIESGSRQIVANAPRCFSLDRRKWPRLGPRQSRLTRSHHPHYNAL
jgi:hypothetical protein